MRLPLLLGFFSHKRRYIQVRISSWTAYSSHKSTSTQSLLFSLSQHQHLLPCQPSPANPKRQKIFPLDVPCVVPTPLRTRPMPEESSPNPLNFLFPIQSAWEVDLSMPAAGGAHADRPQIQLGCPQPGDSCTRWWASWAWRACLLREMQTWRWSQTKIKPWMGTTHWAMRQRRSLTGLPQWVWPGWSAMRRGAMSGVHQSRLFLLGARPSFWVCPYPREMRCFCWYG